MIQRPEVALRQALGDAAFEAWLGKCRIETGDVVTVTAPTRIVRDYVANRYMPLLEKTFPSQAVVLALAADDLAIPEFLRRPAVPLGSGKEAA